ncbi:DNA cytosine methyltransferase [Neisseria meningitidis]|uniref:DNA cytosine methyltransferase n=1 Tax=Neisseria meningitidis TaxID=487 RepID=UPI000FCC2578|nr:DNA (cytosine-5-)-methyltransferase [Neisseria meningitidis]
MHTPLTYIDLFSGAGGLSLGFEQAGFQQLLSVEMESDHCQTYRTNFPHHQLLQKDLTTLTEQDLINCLNGQAVDLIIGGPPCQGFSMAGKIGRTFTDDPRNHLFKEFVRIVKIVQPYFFVMENVARLYTHNSGKTRIEIIQAFQNIGYSVECKILSAADFGVPQIRSRVIFIGRRDKGKISFPEPLQISHQTVGSAIGHFPKLAAGESNPHVANHEAMNHSAQMLEKMAFVKNGGNRNDIPEPLRPKTGDIRKYIRYNSNKPAVCITGDMRKVFHYEQNRALTVRELAALQSFPDNFIFCGSKIAQQQVGNAVPPLLAKAIAESILKMSENE